MTKFDPLLPNDYQINLMADLGAICKVELQQLGYKTINSNDPEELCTTYLNALFRRVEPRPRNFHQSRELIVPANEQAGFDLLKQRIEKGDDLTPHLSSMLADEDFNDPLLNAWRIYHFHLGINAHPKIPGLVERTGPILLGMVQPDDFYAVAILPHGKHGNPDVFYDQDLIEILHQNWPKMMDRYRIKNGKAATPKPTNAEVKLLRDSGVTVIAQTNDGTLYLPTVGFTSVGGTTKDTGAQIVVEVMRIISAIKLLEKTIAEKIVALELAFKRNGGRRPYKIELSNFLNGMVTAREHSSMVGMRISHTMGGHNEVWLDIWSERQVQTVTNS